jgi:hypothetical protein
MSQGGLARDKVMSLLLSAWAEARMGCLWLHTSQAGPECRP